MKSCLRSTRFCFLISVLMQPIVPSVSVRLSISKYSTSHYQKQICHVGDIYISTRYNKNRITRLMLCYKKLIVHQDLGPSQAQAVRLRGFREAVLHRLSSGPHRKNCELTAIRVPKWGDHMQNRTYHLCISIRTPPFPSPGRRHRREMPLGH